MTIPGFGELLALTLAVEIGDISRFVNDRALDSYAGVVPSVFSSGDKTYMGHTHKQGNPYIRAALAEGLYHLLRKDERMKEFYEKIQTHKGTAKARVATMNKILRSLYFMLKYKQPYRIQPLQTSTPHD